MLNKAASRTRLRFLTPQTQSLTLKRYAFWGIQPAFSCFFLTPQMQSLTLKRCVFWGIQLAFPCFLSEKRGEGEQFVR